MPELPLKILPILNIKTPGKFTWGFVFIINRVSFILQEPELFSSCRLPAKFYSSELGYNQDFLKETD